MSQTKAELIQTVKQGTVSLGDADSSHSIKLKAPATVAADRTWTMPAVDPTANQVLRGNASTPTTLEWGTISSTPEGTAILSTGESGATKFLREDGDGTCSWQTPAGVAFDGATAHGLCSRKDADEMNVSSTVTLNGTTFNKFDAGYTMVRHSTTTANGTCYEALKVGGSNHVTNYAAGIGFVPEGSTNRTKIFVGAEGVGSGYDLGSLVVCMNNSSNGDMVTLSDKQWEITKDGHLLSGTTLLDPCGGDTDGFGANGNLASGGHLSVRRTADVCFAFGRSNDGYVGRYYRGSSVVGSISVDSSNTNYNTSSDYRLKENVALITDGITRVKQLKPSKFNWIADDTNTLIDGFLAHEVSSIVPMAVTGTKDQKEDILYTDLDTIPEGKKIGDVKTPNVEIYQQIDQSKLVPLLTAALKEAITKIETLETKVAALEAA